MITPLVWYSEKKAVVFLRFWFQGILWTHVYDSLVLDSISLAALRVAVKDLRTLGVLWMKIARVGKMHLNTCLDQQVLQL